MRPGVNTSARARTRTSSRHPPATRASGRCLCGEVEIEIDVPARWAWHDHSEPSRRAHGAAYATYVGSWRSRFRVTKGEALITRFEDKTTGTVRSFCSRCGAPLFYERGRAPQMVNISRALFHGRTGREPRYHLAIDQMAEWIYAGAALAPLKGFPGVVWERPRRRKRVALGDFA
ncbi:MAG: GFA family protein [Caulobacteraceae bacterium]